MKKLFLAITLLFSIFIPKSAFAQDIKIIVNNQEVISDVAPYIENGRTMVPIRVITEYLGYDINWFSSDQSMTIMKNNPLTGANEGTIGLAIGIPAIVIFDPQTITDCYYMVEDGLINYEEAGKIMFDNSTGIALDTFPVIKNSRTFVPLRVVSEYMGLNVNWDNSTRTVNVSSNRQGRLSLS